MAAEVAVEQAHQAELPALQLRARNKFTRLRCCLHGICERRQRAKIYSCSALHSCTARACCRRANLRCGDNWTAFADRPHPLLSSPARASTAQDPDFFFVPCGPQWWGRNFDWCLLIRIRIHKALLRPCRRRRRCCHSRRRPRLQSFHCDRHAAVELQPISTHAVDMLSQCGLQQLTCTVVDGSSCTNSRTRATVRAISRIFFRLRSHA